MLRVLTGGSCLLCVLCRHLDGLDGHDGHAILVFEQQQADRCVLVVFCVSLHFVLIFVGRGEFQYAYLAVRVAMMVSWLLCVSRRQPDGLVGHDGPADLGFEHQPVDGCVSVVFYVLLHSLGSSGVPAWRVV